MIRSSSAFAVAPMSRAYFRDTLRRSSGAIPYLSAANVSPSAHIQSGANAACTISGTGVVKIKPQRGHDPT